MRADSRVHKHKSLSLTLFVFSWNDRGICSLKLCSCSSNSVERKEAFPFIAFPLFVGIFLFLPVDL